jgi:streptogramin lyase
MGFHEERARRPVVRLALAAFVAVLLLAGGCAGQAELDRSSTDVPLGFSDPPGITACPDGNLWFLQGDGVGRITPRGVVSSFNVSGYTEAITPGPDGNIWVRESARDSADVGRIARITRKGAVTEFPVGRRVAGGGITAGPDGNLWFTEPNTARIGRITPTGVVTWFPTGGGPSPWAITAGPDGNLWFTEVDFRERGADRIGRITPRGVVTHLSVPGTEGVSNQ